MQIILINNDISANCVAPFLQILTINYSCAESTNLKYEIQVRTGIQWPNYVENCFLADIQSTTYFKFCSFGTDAQFTT